MSSSIAENIYSRLKTGKDILSYKGCITPKLIGIELEKIEEELSTKDIRLLRKTYFVTVEALQNLYHHAHDSEMFLEKYGINKKFVIFVLSKNSDSFLTLTTCNLVSKQTKRFLQSRIDQINLLSKQQLRNLYKKILSNEGFTKKGGGGLGMLDMAKKSGNKFEYKFDKFDDDFYFFSLSININN